MRAIGEGTLRSTSGTLYVAARGIRPLTEISLGEKSRIDEDTDGNGIVAVDCDSLPCTDEIEIRLELQRRADGTWPPPSTWTLSCIFNLEIGNRKDLPPDVSIMLELIP
ncbi:MAG: hypothetical protein ACREBE_08315 [bacterium]